ncbi:MAG TPA: alpha-amylase family glycosyl hydrolase [Blastocatellia bacterium]|nr:alpha-amylase family glycosyl hydrolase [Blastocatellia bacterium]
MKDKTTTTETRIPAATYRLQFNSRFTFEQAAGLVDYLYDLGVSDCYASPLLAARTGSPHGYDITDHSKINPEIGSEEEFAEFARRLGRRGMGLIMESVITTLGHLPRRDETSPEMVRERQREKEIIKRRLDLLLTECDVARRAMDNSLRDLNGTKGTPESFDRLERLLSDQAYRLCFWRVAADEINYRRFFDINELAAIRVEDLQVFAAVHELIPRLIERGPTASSGRLPNSTPKSPEPGCTTHWPRRCSRSPRPAYPTFTRERSFGISNWWTLTIAARSISRSGVRRSLHCRRTTMAIRRSSSAGSSPTHVTVGSNST